MAVSMDCPAIARLRAVSGTSQDVNQSEYNPEFRRHDVLRVLAR
jgi:hypothetical protein